MCGRYTLKTDHSKIEEQFGLEHLPAFDPRYNLAPTQDGLVIRPGDTPGTRTAAWLRWGLVPSWAKDRASLPLMINARAETAATRPAFRDAFKHRRCLVVADGFYEWSQHAGRKTPFYFTVHHGEPFAMAGLWERWHPSDSPADDFLETFTILTTTANEVLAPHHDRMPVILPPELHGDWINPVLADRDAIERLLQPFPALHMVAKAVSTRVNSIQNDDPECLAPPPPESHGVGAPTADRGQLGLDLG